jgi:hypothetical protein
MKVSSEAMEVERKGCEGGEGVGGIVMRELLEENGLAIELEEAEEIVRGMPLLEGSAVAVRKMSCEGGVR